DPFHVKRIPSGTTGYVPPNSSLDQPPADTANTVMDRTADGLDVFAADAPLCWRWTAHGTPHDHPDGVLRIYVGQYGCYFDGSGYAHLWENPTMTPGATNWIARDRWQYCRPSQVIGVEHCLRVFPHIGPAGERFLAFAGSEQPTGSRSSGAGQPTGAGFMPDCHVYRVGPEAYRGMADPAPGHVTMAGPIRYDTRRDLKVDVQVSKLGFPTSAVLQDLPAAMPPQTTPGNAVTLAQNARIPSTCTLTAALYDADRPIGGDYAAYDPNVTTRLFARFTFMGDGYSTPVLWGYTVGRPSIVQTVAPGSFAVAGNTTAPALRSVGISHSSGDARQETGSLRVSDLGGTLTRLETRGLLPVQVTTAFQDSSGNPHTATLFRGYVSRPEGARRGRRYNVGRAFPSQDWRDYTLPLAGMWTRLASRVQGPSFRRYGVDPTAPPDPVSSVVPWKATDAIRDMIRGCGFTDSQINIPDLPFRLWPGHDGKADLNVVNPMATLAELIQRMVRLYTGGYLTYDLSYGTDGAWTILFSPASNPDGTYNPVFNFVTAPDIGSVGRVFPHLPGAYPANTAPIINSLNWHNIAPEHNLVCVISYGVVNAAGATGKILNWAYNPSSFNVPGFTTSADPDSADWMPWGCTPCLVIDASLGGAAVDAQDTQRNVDWTVRRVYDAVAHGQQIADARAPLSIIQDPITGNWRALRALDPVSINGVAKYLIKSVNADITRGTAQWATYEIIAPARSQYLAGASALDFYRKAIDARARQANGSSTQSHLHALKSVTPAAEQDILALADYGTYRKPLQDSTGAFFFMDSYDGVGSAPLA
ncbi:MAG: hypothetical protein JO250_15275, partial [Armatimonadetes bacterium]|nr:hypothetical protein [Armatimonadota bacterium]